MSGKKVPVSRNVPLEAKTLRKVVQVVPDLPLIHFHLECGHLISQKKSDFAGQLPTHLECWACASENENKDS